jgi:hypothetical protein
VRPSCFPLRLRDTIQMNRTAASHVTRQRYLFTHTARDRSCSRDLKPSQVPLMARYCHSSLPCPTPAPTEPQNGASPSPETTAHTALPMSATVLNVSPPLVLTQPLGEPPPSHPCLAQPPLPPHARASRCFPHCRPSRCWPPRLCHPR